MMKYTILLSAALFTLHSCSSVTPPPTPSAPDMVAGILANDLVDENAYASKDPSRISVPILRAPDLEVKNGKPDYSVMGDGSYAARYQEDRGRYFTIVGTPRPAKEFSYGVRGTMTVMGHITGYYSTGNEDPEITSKATTLRATDGRSATYLIIRGGPTGTGGEKSLSSNLPRLSW